MSIFNQEWTSEYFVSKAACLIRRVQDIFHQSSLTMPRTAGRMFLPKEEFATKLHVVKRSCLKGRVVAAARTLSPDKPNTDTFHVCS